jgi:hypothetical protein
MIKTVVFWNEVLLCLLMALGLNACTTSVAIHRADIITWHTPPLNQTECPNLNGNYEDRGNLRSPFLIRLITDFQHSTVNGTYKFIQYNSLPYEEIARHLQTKREDIFLRNEALLEIKQTAPYIIEAIRTDKKGIRYWKTVYTFEKMSLRFAVGCYRDAFIIRNVNITGGEHTPAARTQANETHFTRLPNGDLQVIDTERTWSPDGEKPRIKTTVEVFKLYRS